MTEALVVQQQKSTSDLIESAKALARSSVLSRKFNTTDPPTIAANTMLLMQTAQDLGVPPVASLQHIHIITTTQSVTVSLGAHLIMGIIARAKAGTIAIDEGDDYCELTGKRPGGVVEEHTVRYTIEDARQAGLADKHTWKSHRRDMLYARALGRLSRRMWPDLLFGMYVQGEIPDEDAIPAPSVATVTVEPDDNVIDSTAREVPATEPEPTSATPMEDLMILTLNDLNGAEPDESAPEAHTLFNHWLAVSDKHGPEATWPAKLQANFVTVCASAVTAARERRAKAEAETASVSSEEPVPTIDASESDTPVLDLLAGAE